MKTLFGMAAAVLLVVSLLFVSLPGTAGAAGKVSLTEMVSIKKAADEAAQAAKAQAEKAKTAEEKRLAKQLLKQAESNAEVAADLLEAVQEGEEVDREEAEACAAIAKAVNEAAGALAAGNMGKAEGAMGRVAELGSDLPTAANARAEMQRAGADKAGKNQTFTAEDMNKKGKPAEPGSNLPTAANARAEIQRAAGADGAGKNQDKCVTKTTYKFTGGIAWICRVIFCPWGMFEKECTKIPMDSQCQTWKEGTGVVDKPDGTYCEINGCAGKCMGGKCRQDKALTAAMAGKGGVCGCSVCTECQTCKGNKCVPIDNPSPSNPQCLTQ